MRPEGVRSLSVKDLKALLDSGRAPTLLHTLPEEHHARIRLPGAHPACVFQVVFPSRAAELVPDPAAPVVVYGEDAESLEAATAEDKLLRMGYADVRVLVGGLEAWLAAGYPVEGDSPGGLPREPVLPVFPDGDYALDPARTGLWWTGRNHSTTHTGALTRLGGVFRVRNGLLTGEVVADMTSIVNHNLTDPGLRQMLVDHLLSDDFFFVARHPEAVFRLLRAQPLAGATHGVPNMVLSGELHLRGRTGRMEFPATVIRNAEGGVCLETHFDLDRTRFGVLYGSGRFFRRLGMHLVYDNVSLQFRAVAG